MHFWNAFFIKWEKLAFCTIFSLKKNLLKNITKIRRKIQKTENKCSKWLKAICLQSEFDWNLNQVNGADIIDL